MTEFATNNNISASIRLSLFFALKDLYLLISFDIINLSGITTCNQMNKKQVINISKAIQSIEKFLKESLIKVQISQSNHENKHQKNISSDIANKVFLFTKNISIGQFSKKLDYKMIGPFEVIRKKIILLNLQFSKAIKIYNIFYANLL